MRTSQSWQFAAVVAVILAAGSPAVSLAQGMTYYAQVCKKAVSRQVPGGSDLQTSQCGNRFSVQDPYVAIVLTLETVTDSQRINAELIDPGEQRVWMQQWSIGGLAPASDSYWAKVSFWTVLPVAADAVGLANEGALIAANSIKLEGRPAKERPGVWTFRARISSGGTAQARFTLGP
jgi:hypothetical protein